SSVEWTAAVMRRTRKGPDERRQGVDIGREYRGPGVGPLAAPTGGRGDRGRAIARAAPGWTGGGRARSGEGGHPADGARRRRAGGVHGKRRRGHRRRGGE